MEMDIDLRSSLMAGDPRLIDHIVGQVKSQGIFDQFRKECIADVDTKPAYQNLRTRVESSVTSFLDKQVWKPEQNKNQLRETLRKHIHDAPYLEVGVERIVDQVVNPKTYSVFTPQIEDVVYKYLGIERPKPREKSLSCSLKDLLPKDLDPVSPESDRNSLKDVSLESVEDESQPIPDTELEDDKKVLENKDVPSKSENDSPMKSTEVPETEKKMTEEKPETKPSCTKSQVDLNKSEEKADEEEEDSPVFEPIDIMNLNESNISNDSQLSGISELTSHRSHSPEFYFSRDNFDASNQDSQLSKVSSDSRFSVNTDFGSFNQDYTVISDIRDDKSDKAKGKSIRNFDVESMKSKDSSQQSKDYNSKISTSAKDAPRDSTDSTKEVKDKDKSSCSSKEDRSKSSKSRERQSSKDSKSHNYGESDKDKERERERERSKVKEKEREKDKDRDKRRHSSSRSDKSKRDGSRDKGEYAKESSISKLKDAKYDKGDKSSKSDRSDKDSSKRDSSKDSKDLKDMYKEKIRELREKKEMTEKEKLNKMSKSAAEIKDSGSSKTDSKKSKSDERLSKQSNDSSSKSSRSREAEKSKDKDRESRDKVKRSDSSDVKKSSKSYQDDRRGRKDSERTKSYDKNDKYRDRSKDKHLKDKKRRDDRKTSKDDHSSLRKSSSDRRSTDRDGSNGSSNKSSDKSNGSLNSSSNKASSSHLNKESNTSQSCNESLDHMENVQSVPCTSSQSIANQNEQNAKLDSDAFQDSDSAMQLSLPLKKRPLSDDPPPSESTPTKKQKINDETEAKENTIQTVDRREKSVDVKQENEPKKVNKSTSRAVGKDVTSLPDDERVQIIEVPVEYDDLDNMEDQSPWAADHNPNSILIGDVGFQIYSSDKGSNGTARYI